MQIDYFTIIAQIINFLILVYLLRRFLYKPIIKSMEEREKKISSRFEDAEQKKNDAAREAESYRKLLQELSDERQDLIAKTAKEAQVLQTDLIKKVRDDVEASKVKWYEALQSQKESFLIDFGRQVGDEISVIVRRAIQDLANEDLEKQIINTFIKHLQNMDVAEKRKLQDFCRSAGQQITVSSTFEIPEEMRLRIQEIINDQTGFSMKIQYRIDPELICGVELSANDMKIAWNISSYLGALEKELSKALAQRVVAEEQGVDIAENGDKRE